jgi:hypothetical protein
MSKEKPKPWSGTKQAYVMSVPADVSAHEVVRMGRTRGVQLSAAQVYSIRWRAKSQKASRAAREGSEGTVSTKSKSKAKHKPPPKAVLAKLPKPPKPAKPPRRKPRPARQHASWPKEARKHLNRVHPDVVRGAMTGSVATLFWIGEGARRDAERAAEVSLKAAIFELGLSRAMDIIAEERERIGTARPTSE